MRSLKKLKITESIQSRKLVFEETRYDKMDTFMTYFMFFTLAGASILCFGEIEPSPNNSLEYFIITCSLIFSVYVLYCKSTEKYLKEITFDIHKQEAKKRIIEYGKKYNYRITKVSGNLIFLNETADFYSFGKHYEQTTIVFFTDDAILYTLIKEGSFEALYQSGFYWNFLGLAQITAGILLMTQRYATLGALMFLAILTNVWIITISLSFTGTWVITSLMMIAVLVLVIWDQHKLLPIFNYNKASTVKEYPDPGYNWIIAGVVYTISCIALYMLDPLKGEPYEKWLFRTLVLLILTTFAISNYKAYKNHKLAVNT